MKTYQIASLLAFILVTGCATTAATETAEMSCTSKAEAIKLRVTKLQLELQSAPQKHEHMDAATARAWAELGDHDFNSAFHMSWHDGCPSEFGPAWDVLTLAHELCYRNGTCAPDFAQTSR